MYEIYPKLIARANLAPKRNYCFVLMPFDARFDEVYGEMKVALAEIGFDCKRADDLFINRPIMTSIVSEIIAAHFVIADLTDRNPNVFYEVGIAHALRSMPNVLLVSQNMESVPFDLRHLPVILYVPDNLRFLRANLKKRIGENKNFFESRLALRERYPHVAASEADLDEVLLFFEARGKELWDLLRWMLSATPIEPRAAKGVAPLIMGFKDELVKLLAAGRQRLFQMLFVAFRDLLVFYSDDAEIESYVRSILQTSSFPDFKIGGDDMNGLIIDFAIALFQQPRLKRLSMAWLFDYLARPKVGGVDLDRSKVEAFLMTCGDRDVRSNLVACLSHEDDRLREAAADLIGEMRLEEAIPVFRVVLAGETNPYIIRSIFSALGKLQAPEGGDLILQWLQRNGWVFVDSRYEFIPRRAEAALIRIGRSSDVNFVNAFSNLRDQAQGP